MTGDNYLARLFRRDGNSYYKNSLFWLCNIKATTINMCVNECVVRQIYGWVTEFNLVHTNRN